MRFIPPVLLCLLLSAAPFLPPPASAADPSPFGKTVREILVSDLRHTREDLIREVLYSRVGEPYGEENPARDRERLDRLGAFSGISFDTAVEDGEVVLHVSLRETTPWLPLVTADITDADGLTVGPGLKAVNLFGRGIYLSAAARFGQATTVELKSESPWIPGGRGTYRFQGYYRDRYNELYDFQETSLEIDLLLVRPLRSGLGYGVRIGFLSMGSDRDGITLSPGNRDSTPSLGLVLGYDNRDLWSNPHEGWWAQAEAIKNGGVLGGDGDWWSLIGDVRRYQPVRPGHTLQLASYATLQVGEIEEEIPSYRAFHIGGTNSVRGWDLGARKGRNEFINTLEYRWDVMEPRPFTLLGKFTAHAGLQLAFLGDLGLVWDDRSQISADNLIGGVGVGLRLLLPFINVVRFDVAYGERGSRVNLHIGAFDKVVKQRERVR